MSTSITPDNRARFIRSIIALGSGDVLALLAFAALGRASHDLSAENPWLATLQTAAPFIAVWAVAAPLLAVWIGRRLRAFESWRRLMMLTVLTWVLAGPLGLILRSIMLGRPIVLAFALVTMAVAGGILLFCRSVYWFVYRRLIS